MEIETFKVKVIPLGDKLQNMAMTMLANHTEAEDSVQETFIRMWSTREKLQHHPNVEGYAMQTLKNICVDKLRAKRFTVEIENIPIHIDSKTPYSLTEQNDAIAIVRKIIGTLPQLQQQILQMRDVEDYEFHEIASITGASEETIRVTLSRARKKVKEIFMNIERKQTVK